MTTICAASEYVFIEAVIVETVLEAKLFGGIRAWGVGTCQGLAPCVEKTLPWMTSIGELDGVL